MKINILPALVSVVISLENISNQPPHLISPQGKPEDITLAAESYSLSDRYTNSYVNNVFTGNILLTLAYMSGTVKAGDKISWDIIEAPREFLITLKPNQTFAFHDKVLDKYKSSVSMTTNAHFNAQEGFKSDGYLIGDGVCHLASFMNMAALQAGLLVEAPTNHNFAAIADVPKKYGVSIYYTPSDENVSAKQNLYITNPFDKDIKFIFTHSNNVLNIEVKEVQT